MEIQVTKDKTWTIGKPKAAKALPPFVAQLPTVNLLSPSVMEVVHYKRALRTFQVLGVVAVASVIGLAGVGQAAVVVQNNALGNAQEQTTTLNDQVNKLAPIKTFYAGVKQNTNTIQTTMEKEVLYSDVATRLRATLPAGLDLTTITLSAATSAESAPAAGACPGADPFKQANIVGCLTLTGSGPSRNAVGTFINNLARDNHFANPYVSTTNADPTGEVSFSATVALTDQVYPKRYADLDFVLKGANK